MAEGKMKGCLSVQKQRFSGRNYVQWTNQVYSARTDFKYEKAGFVFAWSER